MQTYSMNKTQFLTVLLAIATTASIGQDRRRQDAYGSALYGKKKPAPVLVKKRSTPSSTTSTLSLTIAPTTRTMAVTIDESSLRQGSGNSDGYSNGTFGTSERHQA